MKIKLPTSLVLAGAIVFSGSSLLKADHHEVDLDSLSLPELVGVVFAISTGIQDMGFDDEEQDGLLRGMKIGLNASLGEEELMAVMPQVQNFLQERFMAQQAREAEVNKAAGEEFLASLDDNAAVVRLESGLRYEIIEEGTGEFAGPEDSVLVHYHGTLVDGTVFDSSRERGEPVPFPLGGVIPGFAEGLQKVREGGTIRLFIPSDLAYGDQANPGSPIPAGSTLIFEAELLQINPPEPQRPMMPQGQPQGMPPGGDIPPPPDAPPPPPPGGP